VLLAVERTLCALGVVCLSAYSIDKGQAWLFASREEARLEAVSTNEAARADFSSLGSAVPRLRGSAEAGKAWGQIEVPRLGLHALIAEGADRKTLGHAVGHLPETAFPDEVGNVVLAGHRDSVFRPLSGLVKGDRIAVVTPFGGFSYLVEAIDIVTPDRTDVIAQRPGRVLTLVTCYPFDVFGRAPLRLIARARLIEPDLALRSQHVPHPRNR